MSENEVKTKKTLMDRFLNVVEVAGNKLPDPATLFILLAIIVLILSAIFSSMFKCKAKMDIITDEPSAVNDHPELLALARQTAVELWGDDVLRPMHTLMGSEDFAFIMQRIPGVLGFLGVQDAQSIYPLHSNRFNLDDGNLYKGAGLHAQFALNYLQQGKGGANHV